MLRGTPLDGATASSSQVLRHVRGHMQVSALAHKIRGIESFVAAHGHAPDSRNLLQHLQRGVALGDSSGFPHATRHNQSVEILHQQIPAVAQLGLLACAFARQKRVGIGFRFVGLVRALLPAKIHRDFRDPPGGDELFLSLGLKTLHASPRFQQRAIHGEVFVRGPSLRSRLLHHPRQKFLGDLGLQQPVAVLGEPPVFSCQKYFPKKILTRHKGHHSQIKPVFPHIHGTRSNGDRYTMALFFTAKREVFVHFGSKDLGSRR